MPADFTQQLLELITRTSTQLPDDVHEALKRACATEEEGTPAKSVFNTLLENIHLADKRTLPLCQDTGTISFLVSAPLSFPRKSFRQAAEAAVVEATRRGILRQNCVDSVTGKNTGNNLGFIHPVFYFEDAEDDRLREAQVTLLLKGGGSENMGIQYSLPDADLNAARDLEGVRKCILDAVYRAQGKGCAPGILGVAIGGDRTVGFETAKMQLLRKIGQRSPNPALAELETRCLREANELGVGPMGLGGKNTLLDVFVAARTRHPASFFVTICYNCWCMRRQSATLNF